MPRQPAECPASAPGGGQPLWVLRVNVNMRPLLAITALALCGCSAHPDPIVDTTGVNMTVYAQDLEECKGFAGQIDPGTGMAKGAAAGAATGAAIGAISSHRDIGESAGIGAVWGISKSGVKAANDKENVVKRCMRYRGYQVLN